ncbi:MAG TPA: PD-(D/E)XK nuclease family protein, partial [Bacteroidales bacterium]|nr:PD-(D/E)XK nuclease family protein [Bacteroidales bacterium]
MTSIPFLKEIAGIILKQGYDLPSLCMVFPNKRARLYLSRYIGELTSKPVWAPGYFTISELMEKISGYQVVDRLYLLFELYNAYIKATGSSESFDTFYPYGETLLNDFDEIDKYLVNADDIFRNLSDLKDLEGRFNYLSKEQLEYIQ